MSTTTVSSARSVRASRVARALLGVLAVFAPLSGGCGAGLSGTYADAEGLGSLEFKDDGTVYMTTFGGTIACTYELDGDRVILKGPNGSQVLTRQGDRLDGGLGFSFVKR